MLEVTSLGSGSCGNALLVRTTAAVILVDCGVGVRRLASALTANGLRLSDVDALLISHEHSDHIRELPRFASGETAILASTGTALAARVPRSALIETRPERPVRFADVDIIAIPVSHDALEPCGFLVRTPAGSLTVLTDLGTSSAMAAEAVAESRLAVLEANHDEAMLRQGPYPWHLKRRVLSDAGHLSNAACAELLVAALAESRHIPTVWLAHLSETNNRPQLARKTVERRLAQAGIRLDLQALPRREVSATWRPETARQGAAQLTLDLTPASART